VRRIDLIARAKLVNLCAQILKYLLKDNGNVSISINPTIGPKSKVYRCHGGLKKIGIVIQGPISSQQIVNNVKETLNSLEEFETDLNFVIVISTWQGAEKYLDALPSKVKVVVNQEMNYSNNLQRQAVSTLGGLRYLEELGCDFVFKMRVDQYVDLALLIPSGIEISEIFNQTGSEIGFTNFNSYANRFFGLSDMLNFGFIDSMLTFWNCDFESEFFRLDMTISLPYENWVNHVVSHWFESWLCIRYAHQNGFVFSENPWTDYEKFIRQFVLLLDSDWINQKWLKWNSPFKGLTERAIFNPQVNPKDLEISWFEWFSIKNSIIKFPRNRFDLDRSPQ
jgi:WavE lipopolysaccharide synthesis